MKENKENNNSIRILHNNFCQSNNLLSYQKQNKNKIQKKNEKKKTIFV